jgi:hypothetical protein
MDTEIFTCTYGCHSSNWCAINGVDTYDELTCPGDQVCCSSDTEN